MTWFQELRRSIRFTQVVTVLVASLTISLILSTAQLTNTYLAQQEIAILLGEEILTLAEGGATTASWTLDERLAREVVQSVIALRDVQTVTLLDENDSVLASADRDERDYGTVVSWIAGISMNDAIERQRDLTVAAGGGVRRVGTLAVVLAPEQIAARFVSLAVPVLVAGLLQALAIGLVLLWLTSRLVTTPLQRAASEIAQVDPEDPRPIAIPPAHRTNELGHLLHHTNLMVDRLRNVQEQFRTLATHDTLTELPNRSFVVARLERALVRAGRNRSRVAVLFLDLDNFKAVNDSHGHTHGDELLKQVSTRLQRVLRSNDSVGRLGGDEFLIVIEAITVGEETVATVQRIETALTEPFELGKNVVRITGSVGIAVYPDDGETATELMRHADMAMYQAKEDPASHFHFFAPEMSARIQARLNLEAALREALARGDFELAFQPKVDARTNALAGCEALLRWRRDGRTVAAAEFIETAERAGIITEIGYSVLEQAAVQAREWAHHYGPIPIAINVSAEQLRAPGFVDRVLETAARHGIEAGQIELEITETVLVEELTRASQHLDRLRTSGFVVSIDDFGTGYSSLSYLTHLPADSLKIDRSFVSGPQSSEVVLDMILAMAQALRLTTVAEGVETEEQRQRLVSRGCDVLQGYLLGKPMRGEEFEEQFLRRHQGAQDVR